MSHPYSRSFMPKPAILEKDLKARIDQGYKLTLTIKAAPNNEYFFQMQQGKTTVVLTTHQGRVRMFKDLNRMIAWAEALGIHRIVMDLTLPRPEH